MEYRFDGLRFDAVHAILEQDWVDEMAAAVRATVEPGRHVHLVLEHHNDASHLGKDIDAQWNDDGHNVLHVLLTGEDGGYYLDYADQPAWKLARCLAEGFIYQGEQSHYTGEPRGMPSGHLPPTAFVLFLQNHDQIGNRAFGERLTALVEPAALEAAIALLMLCPQIPLLFMGEETASRTPFLFFTDHHAELADAVREGRRSEFAKFPAFADPASRERIPDPNAPETFAASVPHADPVLGPAREALYRRLIALRATAIVPRLDGARALTAEVIGPKAVVARWRLGDGAILTLASNLDADAVPLDLPAGQPAVCQRGHAASADCRATAPALSSMSLGRPMSDEAIRDLARRAGIAVEWHDFTGSAEDCRARGAAPHARGARPALRHARRPAGQPQAAAAQVQRAGAAAADHGNGGPADTA